MATISLYAEPINRMTGLFRQTQTVVFNFQEEFLAMQTKSIRISNDTCDMQDVISSIQASTRIQEEKIATLTDFERECEDFIEDMERIDTAVADVITSRKDKFYEEYPYLKPEEEKKKLIEKLKDVLTKTADWCKAHWKELLATTLIVIGVIAAIVVIVGSKGLALAPVLTALLTAFGVATSTAATIATVTSIAIATIAVISLIGSATLNIIDTWKDMSENPTFQKWQTALNITSAVSNTIYSIGEILSLLCIKMGIVPKSGAGVGRGFMDDVVEGGTSANTLTDAQKSRLNVLENTINDHLTDGDFSGTLRDLQGNPVPNGRGGSFDHLGEMQDSYKSLQKIKKALEGSLKNPNLSDVDRALLQEGLDKANFYINKIEELFEPYGGIN